MATFVVNITISAGNDFSQVFYLKNPDKSPVDLTGATFSANLAKHSRSQDALAENGPVYKMTPFMAGVVDASLGTYSISLSPEQTSVLEEGKYVYSVAMTNTNGVVIETISGLAFVDHAFGNLR